MIDKEKIIQGIKLFLEGIGEDITREGIKETPERVARMWEEFEKERSFDFKLFEEYSNYSEMIIVKDIPFYSMCEHHLLPFFGKAHIAYIPNKKICGLSKLVRTVKGYGFKTTSPRKTHRGNSRYSPKRVRTNRGWCRNRGRASLYVYERSKITRTLHRHFLFKGKLFK
jgi:GTP cyclohydrolase I (EC 3.5.4.16)